MENQVLDMFKELNQTEWLLEDEDLTIEEYEYLQNTRDEIWDAIIHALQFMNRMEILSEQYDQFGDERDYWLYNEQTYEERFDIRDEI
jgi:hypothetical protein